MPVFEIHLFRSDRHFIVFGNIDQSIVLIVFSDEPSKKRVGGWSTDQRLDKFLGLDYPRTLLSLKNRTASASDLAYLLFSNTDIDLRRNIFDECCK